jgi:pyruvate dehydrogenase E2 component (dihydrolipoamide acetyltransferase)
MAVEFRLHDVGEGIDAAEVVEWHVAVGDEVKEDQPLVDVQTDKAIVALPCPRDGVVLELRWQVGDMVPVGEVLAVFGEESELRDVAATEAGDAARAEALPGAPAAAASASAEGAAGGTASHPAAGDGPAAAPRSLEAMAASVAARPLASPAVRALARERGIDLREVHGSGPGGRILRDDLRAEAPHVDVSEVGAGEVETAAVPVPAEAPREDQVVPLRGTRRAIARNLTRSWQEIPHIVDFREADATELLAARLALREKLEAEGRSDVARALTPLALVAKIAATVARRHPRSNASVDMEREEITLHGAVNLSVAIATPDGLVTPVVRDADRKAVPAIAGEIAALATAARERSLTPEQFAGGTLTVNNFGVLGSPFSTPIIPMGQAVNLGLGRIAERPLARDGEVVVRPVLGISCSGDHRVLDGADLSRFVNDIVAAVERPVLLLAEVA